MLKKILRISLVVVMAGYLLVALSFTSHLSATRQCRGMEIELDDPLNLGFVRTEELKRDLGHLYSSATGRLLYNFPLDSVEARLMASDKIESVQAVILTNDSVKVTVCPLVPAARIFDGTKSYYINRSGKRIGADARYHMDVPVIKGNFTSTGLDPVAMLPLADYIENHSPWNDLISMIEVRDSMNIYLIPDIRGQVIKFGSLDAVDDKFDRLARFYKRVMPYKGWNYYDTIAVKWAGQVVASRSDKVKTDHRLPVDTLPQSAYDEALPILNVETSPN